VLPISHSIEAIRAAVLSGATLADITDQLAATAVTSVVFLLIGVAGLRHLDEVVRRRGTMDLL
jgi:hypothetical protein